MRYVLVKYFITCICSAYEIHVTANSMRPPSSIIGIIHDGKLHCPSFESDIWFGW